MQYIDWKRIGLVVFVLVVLGNLANNYYDRRDRLAVEHARSIQNSLPELRVLSSSQSSDGVSEGDLTPQLADQMAKYGASRLASKFEEIYRQSGTLSSAPKILSDATVVKVQEKTLIIVRYDINASAKAVEIFGVSGLNLDRVMCTRESLDDILITSGPCAQKILEIHGVTLNSLSK